MQPMNPPVIKFFAPVNEATIHKLMAAVDAQIAAGARQLTLLMSTNGGSVFHGLSAYNYLKGLPLELTTHNFGSVDSIGVPLYCSGDRRYCVPQARFLLHPVTMNFAANSSYEELQLLEKIKSMRVDMENCARIVAANTGRTTRQVLGAMRSRTTLDPQDALQWTLVHEIRQELFPAGTEVISITP
ncbi:MAG: ATP-dependent Clp protease proteolytic subunit [Steroidobacteraceae bacterium]|nr:ATP-dependent Clp protease proteolytic subunit [Steroidobacteraceae bacterium]MDW8258748.1 ATP-dependent Clp protease proteolytic subunit [Gammaproteobacteria bacterium]